MFYSVTRFYKLGEYRPCDRWSGGLACDAVILSIECGTGTNTLACAGVGASESVNGTTVMLGLAAANEDHLRLIPHQISTPMMRSASTPPTTPPTIGPTSVWLSFGRVEIGAKMVLDGELKRFEVVEVVEGEPNGGPLSSPLTAICFASVLLNCASVQSLGSS